MKRDTSIDLLKSIAIMFVVLYHSNLFSSNFLDNDSCLFYIRYYIKTLLSSCVPLFFIANGYLLLSKPLQLKKHIRKIIHFMTITVIWSFLLVVLIMPIEHEAYSLSGIFNAIIQMRVGWTNHLWFMGALVCLYYFFPLIKIVYDSNKLVFYYFTVICVILSFGNSLLNEGATLFSSILLKKNTVYYNSNFFLFFNPFNVHAESFAYFCIGGVLFSIKDRLHNITVCRHIVYSVFLIILGSTILFVIGVYNSKLSNAIFDIVFNSYSTVFTLFISLGIWSLCLLYQKDIYIIREISCNTLGIYMFHVIIINLTKPYFIQFPLCRTLSFNIAYTIAILLICLFISKGLKTIPFISRIVS